jgi:hypothetical protein
MYFPFCFLHFSIFIVKLAFHITFSVQKMFGTFYRNTSPENAFSNILKCFNRIAKPKYLLHGVSARAKIILRQSCSSLVFHRFVLLSAFFSCFKMNENSSSARTFFRKNSILSKAFNKNFSRLFSNYFQPLFFSKQFQPLKFRKEKSRELVSRLALRQVFLSSR